MVKVPQTQPILVEVRRSSKSGNADGPEERVAPEKRNRTTPNAEKEGEEYQAKDFGQHGSKKVSWLLISNEKPTHFLSVVLTTIVRSQGCESEGPNSPTTMGWTAPTVNLRPFPGK